MSVFTGYKNVLIKNICFDSLFKDQKAEQVIEVKPYGMYVYTRFVKPMHQSSVGINNT